MRFRTLAALCLTLSTLGAVPRRALAQDSTRADSARRQPGARRGPGLPLVPTRHDTFTVREGTWISLDVSPDGQTIVFDLLGDIYRMPVTGGAATRLTSGPAFDGQPRFSPDGRTIVFTSDRSGSENLWLMDADGQNAHPLTRGDNTLFASPVFSPDGQYVVAARVEGSLGSRYDLYLYNVNGGTGLQMTRAGTPPMNAMGPAFGPDGRYVWFARRAGGFSYNQVFPTWELAVYDRRTGEVHQQTGAWGSGMRPLLSHDGKWLVYATREGGTITSLRLRDLATGDEHWLIHNVQRDDQESRYTRDLMPGMAFMPDDRSIVLSYGGKIMRVAVPSGTATEIPFTAQVQLDMGPLVHFTDRISDSAITVRQIRGAALSPDGRRVAFTALDRLYLATLPTDTSVHTLTSVTRVTGDTLGEHMPAWSPDGQWLAWIAWSDTGGGTIWKINVGEAPAGRRGARPAPARPVRVSATPAYYARLAFSPDGSKILAVRGPRFQRIEEEGGVGIELVWLPAGGGQATLITRVGREATPHFVRADSDRIYYYDAGGLVSFRYDGTDRRSLLRVTGYTPPPSGTGPPQPDQADEILMSPLGGRAIATVDELLYLVAVPQVSDSAVRISISNPAQAPMPVRKLTTIAADFIGFAPDGRTAYWSLGRFFFRYDLATGDSVAALLAKDTTLSDSARGRAGGNGGPGGAGNAGGGQPAGQPATPADSARMAQQAAADSLRRPHYSASRLEVVMTAPRDVPRGTTVLRGARIITVRGGGDEVIADGDVVITDNRIAQVCNGRCAGVPAGAHVIDAAGTTIMPGIVDVHAHPWPTWGIHKGQVWKFMANLAYGVTTTRDPQTATTDVLAYSDLVETGAIVGPRIFSTGPGVFWTDNPQSIEQTRDILRRYSEYYLTGTIKQYMVGTRRQRQWVIMAAREQNLMPTTEGGLDFKMNLTLMLDGYSGLEHSLPITPLYADVLQLLARSGITYTPTMLVNYGGPWGENYWYEHNQGLRDDPKLRRFIPQDELDRRFLRRPQWFADSQYYFPRLAESARNVIRAGGRMGLGGHGQLDGMGDQWELWSIQSGGMTPLEAIRIATWNGAWSIGLGEDVGSLEAGKLADLLVLDGNPLDDIHNTNRIRWVMKNGRLYDAQNLDEVWPTPRRMPVQWWQREY